MTTVLDIYLTLNRFFPNELIIKILPVHRGICHPLALIVNDRKKQLKHNYLWLREPIHMTNYWHLFRSCRIISKARCFICKKGFPLKNGVKFIEKKNLMETSYVEELKKLDKNSFRYDTNKIIYYHSGCVNR